MVKQQHTTQQKLTRETHRKIRARGSKEKVHCWVRLAHLPLLTSFSPNLPACSSWG